MSAEHEPAPGCLMHPDTEAVTCPECIGNPRTTTPHTRKEHSTMTTPHDPAQP